MLNEKREREGERKREEGEREEVKEEKRKLYFFVVHVSFLQYLYDQIFINTFRFPDRCNYLSICTSI